MFKFMVETSVLEVRQFMETRVRRGLTTEAVMLKVVKEFARQKMEGAEGTIRILV